jgi:catechol 2,3-dioxygenase-like lactoylglutathione lyase family enzyme
VNEHQALQKLGELVGHDRVDQVAYLVPDIDEAVAEWNAVLGPRTWLTWHYSAETLPRLGFRGGPGEFEMRIALSAEAPQIELIQPISGPSIYHEWIARRGYGPHHIGRFVVDIETAVAALRELGVEPIQWGADYGLDGDGGFAYYEFGPDRGTVVELIQPPARRPVPVAI